MATGKQTGRWGRSTAQPDLDFPARWPMALAAAMLIGVVLWYPTPVQAAPPSLAVPAIAQLPGLGPRSTHYPQRQHPTVNDHAQLLSPEAQAQLDADLNQFRATTGIEIVVVTVPSFARYGTQDASFERFATNLFNTWGIGDASRNNGVLVLLSEGDRSVRIELGKGYNHAYDRRMKMVIDEYMVPRFRNGDYSDGLQRGIQALKTQLTTPADSIETLTAWPLWPWVRNGGLLAAIAAAGVGGWHGVAFLARPTCFSCRIKMNALTDAEDNFLLKPGQLAERRVKSVQHIVYKCPQCATHDFHRFVQFSSFQDCPQCQYRTLKTLQTTTLVQPTYSAGGSARAQRSCCHCNHQDETTIALPRLERPSDSTSSGGYSDSGSSGGGSSDGGGASGSW